MRHEKMATSRRLDMADIVAVWPVSAQIAPVPIPDMDPAPVEIALARTSATPAERGRLAPLLVTLCTMLIAAFVAGALTRVL